VDILVKGGRNQARAVSAIKALYPQLEVRNFAGVTAFFIAGEKESVLDVTYPHRADLEETLRNPSWVKNKELGLRYRVPSLPPLTRMSTSLVDLGLPVQPPMPWAPVRTNGILLSVKVRSTR
jgi:hypothetical protein